MYDMKRSFFAGARIVAALVVPVFSFAQNTLEGRLAIVPEAEVNRQSAFVDAERERMLSHWDKAQQLYKTFLRDNPNVDAAWYGLAQVQAELDSYGDALESISKAIALDKANPWYPIFQADLLERAGRAADAADVYAQLIRTYPDNTDYIRHLVYLQTLAGNPQDALKTLEKLEKKTGFSPEIADKRHILYVGLGENKKAGAELERLVSAYPDRLDYRHRLADFYRQLPDEANAKRVYADILKKNPKDPAALLATGKGTVNNVLADPNVPLDSKIREVTSKLITYQQKPNPTLYNELLAAAAALEQAHPADPRTWSFSGDVYYLGNQPAEALERYQRCLQFPQTPFTVWENTLQILYDQNKDDQVLATAEKAMDVWPNQPSAYLYFGRAAIRLGRTKEAIPVLQQAKLMTSKSTDTALKQDIQEALEAAEKQK
jgi:tetratricopeptide (TPR) repeat protein